MTCFLSLNPGLRGPDSDSAAVCVTEDFSWMKCENQFSQYWMSDILLIAERRLVLVLCLHFLMERFSSSVYVTWVKAHVRRRVSTYSVLVSFKSFLTLSCHGNMVKMENGRGDVYSSMVWVWLTLFQLWSTSVRNPGSAVQKVWWYIGHCSLCILTSLLLNEEPNVPHKKMTRFTVTMLKFFGNFG